MASASILCAQCGNASATPLSHCVKCGGKNARVCAGCGCQNSLAKNYCDKCGNPISDLGAAAPPPSALRSDIPVTVVKRIPLDSPPKKEGPPPVVMPHQAEKTPRTSRWIDTLRRALTAVFATTVVIVSLAAIWYWSEYKKPENAVRRAAAQYLQALRARDYAAAYYQLSDSARSYCTLDEFSASRDASPWTWSGLRIERMEPGAGLLAYELAVQGAPARTDRILFVEETTQGVPKWVRPYNWSLMRKIEAAFREGDAAKGLSLAQAAATINPRDPTARAYLCEAAYDRKSPVDAERQCAAAIELSRLYPSELSLKSLYHLHGILADIYKNALRKPDLALDHFSRMLDFPSASPADQCEILLARSESYVILSRPGEALADADRADRLCARPRDLAYVQEIRRKLNAPN